MGVGADTEHETIYVAAYVMRVHPHMFMSGGDSSHETACRMKCRVCGRQTVSE